MDVFLTAWNQKMRKNYSGNLYKARKATKRPQWMSEEVYADFQKLWATEAARVNYLSLF